MEFLKQLLEDISTGKIESKDLPTAFDKIAKILLQNTKIVTPKSNFHLREIEVYFYSESLHPDPYTHAVKRQLEFGEWYFHRLNDVKPFLRSRRNGLDITFGNKNKSIFGGILIRKIENIRTKEPTVGINRVVRKLIENIGEENINEIALGFGQQVFDNQQLLHIETDDNNSPSKIFKTQRYGLTDREDELSKLYFKIPYCYYNHDLDVAQIKIEI